MKTKITPINGDLKVHLAGCAGCGWLRGNEVFQCDNGLGKTFSVRVQCKAVQDGTAWFHPNTIEIKSDACPRKKKVLAKRARDSAREIIVGEHHNDDERRQE